MTKELRTIKITPKKITMRPLDKKGKGVTEVWTTQSPTNQYITYLGTRYYLQTTSEVE